MNLCVCVCVRQGIAVFSAFDLVSVMSLMSQYLLHPTIQLHILWRKLPFCSLISFFSRARVDQGEKKYRIKKTLKCTQNESQASKRNNNPTKELK